MSIKKMYVGEQYSFYRKERRIGHGGNGAVYDIEIQEFDYPVVAKFFEYDGKYKEKRYKRFKKEIEIMYGLQGINGILPILDKKIPLDLPNRKDEAWFLMPKAQSYKVNRSHNLLEKINDMIALAKIIKELHGKDYAHRDIKPENILNYNGKLVLSDFGLIWAMEEERLTEYNERIGPYKILPPELEHVNLDMEIEYKFSDVYLFAKVLWMTIKEDDIGFRGQYKRGDSQIYLRKESYGIITFEPIHKLMEEATNDDINQRITIEQCIDYLELQKEIVEDNRKIISQEMICQLQYEENSKKLVAENEPDEITFYDKHIIYKMIQSVIALAKIEVSDIYDKKNTRTIQITDIFVNSDDTCKLVNYSNGRKIKEYLIKINNLIYSKKNETFTLILGEVNLEDNEYILFTESQKGFGESVYSKIFLGTDQKILIHKP